MPSVRRLCHRRRYYWIRVSIIVSSPKNSVNATRFYLASKLLEVVDLALLARVM